MILIKGGKLVTCVSISAVDILINDSGKIEKIGKSLSFPGAEKFDAKGLHILPGAIDSHVHFRDPEDTSKEDFSTGSASALAGGVTTIMDMPNYRNPPTTTISAYEQKRRIAKAKSRCDYLLRFGASETNFSEAANSGASQLKIFMSDTKSELGCSKAAMIEHFRRFPKNQVVCVHAEDREIINKREKKYKQHEKIRDKIVSQIASKYVLEEAWKLRRRVHLCHLTTGLEIALCRQYANATYEINPVHLYLSTGDLKLLGIRGLINPPIRDKREQSALWRQLGNDTIIASDHAPHLPEQKDWGAPGYPGVGTMLPLMLQAVHERRLLLEQVVKMCCCNPAKAFGLKSKAAIFSGGDADLVLVDMKKKWVITAENRLSKCGWTPFEGKEVYGKIEKVFLRGKLAYESDGDGGGKVLSKRGDGREIG